MYSRSSSSKPNFTTVRRAAASLRLLGMAILIAGLGLPMGRVVHAAPGEDGSPSFGFGTTRVVNGYSTLTAATTVGQGTITVASSAALALPATSGAANTTLAAGDLLLIYQAQGAAIDTATNGSTYGAVTAYNGAGLWEFVYVGSVAGNTITLDTSQGCGGIRNVYASGAQVVRVPQYSALSLGNNRIVQATAWNGTIGGIVAIHVTGATTFSGSGRIDVTGQGFRGGAVENNSSSSGTDVPTWRSSSSFDGANKGESIAGPSGSLANGAFGRGAPANGGGGGNGHNAGGGGGANGGNVASWNSGLGNPETSTAAWATAWNLETPQTGLTSSTTSTGGGRGGYTYGSNDENALTRAPGASQWGGDNRRERGGRGGRPLDRNAGGLSRYFFGGGGGAGDGNNDGAGAGGNGGGLVFLVTDSISASGSTSGIRANGAAGQNTSASGNDAPGGGGGGGTIIVVSPSTVPSGLNLSAVGGVGGNQTITGNESEGPGGGGGGGVIALPGGVASSSTVRTGGLAGRTNSGAVTEFTPNGATAGASGELAAAPDPAAGGATCIGSTVPITLASIGSDVSGGGLRVYWTTSTETGNMGFWLYGRQSGGEWKRLNDRLVLGAAGGDALTPRSYEFVAAGGHGLEELVIEDVDVQGKATRHGPFAVGELHGVEEQASAIDWKAVAVSNGVSGVSSVSASFRSKSGISSTQSFYAGARLLVKRGGLYRLTYEDLLAENVNLGGIPASKVGVFNDGQPMVRYVGGGEVFGPGSWIEFVMDDPAPSLYVEGDVLVVRGSDQDQPTPISAPPGLMRDRSGRPAEYIETAESATQREYDLSALGDDPWYDARLLAYAKPVEVSRTLQVNEVAGGQARLEVSLWGVTNWPGSQPDHHVQILLNDSVVIDDRFDGAQTRLLSATFPASQLRSGANTVVVRVTGDTGFDWDVINLDAIRLEYLRTTVAASGHWAGVVDSRDGNKVGRFLVSGFSGDSVVGWGRRNNGAHFREEVPTTAGGVVLPNKGGEGIAYWIHDSGTELKPEILPGVPEAASPVRADYLIITHPLFLGAELDDLVQVQQGRGLTVSVVDVHSLYAAYSDHAVDPEAIRRFVAASKPRYVLLVGGDTYDYNNYLGLGSLSFVPTHYVSTSAAVRYSPSDVRHGDTNADGVPDIPVGRLPVRTKAELGQLVTRLSGVRSSGGALFISGKSDTPSREFEAANQRMVAAYGRTATTLSVDEDGVSGARPKLLSALAGNPELVSFHGHTSYGLWDFGGLFRATDIKNLPAGTELGLVTQWGCWNTYFVSPQYNTMAHGFLLTPGRGAAAVLGSATLSESSSHSALSEALLPKVGAGSTQRLGDALIAAQRDLAKSNPDALDALLGMNLMGDPAMPLTLH